MPADVLGSHFNPFAVLGAPSHKRGLHCTWFIRLIQVLTWQKGSKKNLQGWDFTTQLFHSSGRVQPFPWGSSELKMPLSDTSSHCHGRVCSNKERSSREEVQAIANQKIMFEVKSPSETLHSPPARPGKNEDFLFHSLSFAQCSEHHLDAINFP